VQWAASADLRYLERCISKHGSMFHEEVTKGKKQEQIKDQIDCGPHSMRKEIVKNIDLDMRLYLEHPTTPDQESDRIEMQGGIKCP
jgi:hypothetical protein